MCVLGDCVNDCEYVYLAIGEGLNGDECVNVGGVLTFVLLFVCVVCLLIASECCAR